MKENKEQEKVEENLTRFFDARVKKLLGAILVIVILICCLPVILVQPSKNSTLDFTKTGQIGDTIGGIMGPFVAILAATLTFFAFWVQYKANQQQTEQFRIQARDSRIDRFESRLSELIKIHRDNLNEIDIDGIKGRKAFISMLQEIKFSYYCVKEFFIHTYSNELLLDIAYRVFYLGIEQKSLILLNKSLQDKLTKPEIAGLISHLDYHKAQYKKGVLMLIKSEGFDFQFILDYEPFDGHVSKLGHYFRHLYHTVKFIATQDNEFLPEKEKQEYAKTVRSQLSDYEQLILFYDINSAFGNAWITDGFIRRFRMIKNLPMPLADFGITPEAKFEDDVKYWNDRNQSFFQWDERKWSNS
jgi:hypothetical protein